ncbi:Apolipoprotein L1 [Dissostichus eleginoides]|uniref:Apolipoprotein L1 n=1 Tax=Dissostichus eleginoides TaxID=100907 RepID=A0AAD9FKM7_DISEL|nr:Apolipoprotein L1 [Dissostichus eleginoides]
MVPPASSYTLALTYCTLYKQPIHNPPGLHSGNAQWRPWKSSSWLGDATWRSGVLDPWMNVLLPDAVTALLNSSIGSM